MKTWIRSTAAAGALAAVSLAAQQANAGCGFTLTNTGLTPSVYLNDRCAGLAKTGFDGLDALKDGADGGPFNTAAITGQWKFTFVSDGKSSSGPPLGVLVDSGFVTWHDDGTDLIHSSHAPITDSIAEGVWRKLGRTYEVNNWALPWTPDGSSFAGPVNIQESITLDRDGNSYSGTFTITVYNPPPAQSTINPLNEKEQVLPGQFLFDTSGGTAAEITGVITGARVTF